MNLLTFASVHGALVVQPEELMDVGIAQKSTFRKKSPK
jgi:hypothetical protein